MLCIIFYVCVYNVRSRKEHYLRDNFVDENKESSHRNRGLFSGLLSFQQEIFFSIFNCSKFVAGFTVSSKQIRSC